MKRQYVLPFMAMSLLVLAAGCNPKVGQDEAGTPPSPTSTSAIVLVTPQSGVVQEELPSKTIPSMSDTKQDSPQKPSPSSTNCPVSNPKPGSEATPSASPSSMIAPTPTIQKTPTPTSEKPKTIYDYPFDASAIQSAMIAKGRSMGMTYQSGMTPNNASWEMPVSASKDFQGTVLKKALMDYIGYYTPANVGAYGGEPIQYFSIYVKKTSDGYTFYFLH